MPRGTAVVTLVMRSLRSCARVMPVRRSTTPSGVFRSQISESQSSARAACFGSLRARRSTALMVEELARRVRVRAESALSDAARQMLRAR